jgi:hypothetical protein
MSVLKTRPTQVSVLMFLGPITDPVRRRQCRLVSKMMADTTRCRLRM